MNSSPSRPPPWAGGKPQTQARGYPSEARRTVAERADFVA